MKSRNKFYLMLAGLMLLVLAILLWPQEPRRPPSVATGERFRPANRPPITTLASREARRAKDLESLAKLVAEDQITKLSPQEIDNYVKAQHRSMDSLLTAFRLSEDPAYLKEALANFPNHPQVLLCALHLDRDPAKRLALLEAFKRADPENGIGNCLAARALFDLGKNDEALAELLQSRGKPIRDYWMSSSQNDEEAYLSAGFSPIRAKMTSLFGTSMIELVQMRMITEKLDELRSSYASAGDSDAVQSVREIQSELGNQLQKDPSFVGELVGIDLEKGALKGLDDPESIARLEEIDQKKKSLSEGIEKIDELMKNATVPESDWLLYLDRVKLFGEKAAMDWMLRKYQDL